MTAKEREALATAVVDLVKKVVDPLKARLQALEADVAETKRETVALKAAPKSLDYQGIWQRAINYQRNEVVTHKSAMWACLTDQVRGVEPGTSPAAGNSRKRKTRDDARTPGRSARTLGRRQGD